MNSDVTAVLILLGFTLLAVCASTARIRHLEARIAELEAANRTTDHAANGSNASSDRAEQMEKMREADTHSARESTQRFAIDDAAMDQRAPA